MQNAKNVKLEKLIKKGKGHYILVYGVLMWGVISATLFLLAQYWLGESLTVPLVLISFIVFPAIGVLWSYWMWLSLKKRYDNTVAS